MRRPWCRLLSLERHYHLRVGMDTKHLSKGSKCPPPVKGKMRLYSMRFCPYAERAHLVLDAKKIPHEIVNVHLAEKPEWFFERNPLGKVPAIELESGDCIFESLIIADYLDEVYPKTPLHNKDPLQKAKDKLLIERFGKVSSASFFLYKEPSSESLEKVLVELDVFEKELASRGKKFFGGEKPGIVDYMIWPWIERMDAFKYSVGDKYVIPEKRFVKLEEWKKAMLQDEAVKKVYISPENHGKFIQSYISGSPNYDILAKL